MNETASEVLGFDIKPESSVMSTLKISIPATRPARAVVIASTNIIPSNKSSFPKGDRELKNAVLFINIIDF